MYLTLVLTLVAIGVAPVAIGWQASVVQSGSMRPHIQPGDVVVTAPLPANKPLPLGRVVAFHNPAAAEADGTSSIRLHRIVHVNDDNTFVTKGDANLDNDSTAVTRSQIIGQARLLVPAIGLPSLWLSHRDYLPLLGVGAATLIALALVALDFTPRTPRTRRAPDQES